MLSAAPPFVLHLDFVPQAGRAVHSPPKKKKKQPTQRRSKKSSL
jgi:hypothetical protein